VSRRATSDARRVVRSPRRCGDASSAHPLGLPMVARLDSGRSTLAPRAWSRHTPLRCVTPALGSSGLLDELCKGGKVMGGIDSLEGQPSVCGAVVRRYWLTGGDTGKSACGHSGLRLWSLQVAPVITPGRSVHSGAWAASWLCWLNTERASVAAGTPARGATARACACSTAPRLSGARACSSVKRGDCRHLSGSVWIRLDSPDLAQCPDARRLGTVGGMSHATQNAPQRTRRAPALPRREACATCPAVAKPAQQCPTRPVALTVRGGTRDNAARAVRHDGGPRNWGRPVVNGTRSASSLRAPGVRAARLQALAGFGLSRHGVARPGDRRAASHLEQSGECQP
jgi:hypothetical protein